MSTADYTHRYDTKNWKIDVDEFYQVMLDLDDYTFGLILSSLVDAMDRMNPDAKLDGGKLMSDWVRGLITLEELLCVIFDQFYAGYKVYLSFRSAYNYERVLAAIEYLYSYYNTGNQEEYVLSFCAEEVYDVVERITRHRLSKFQVHMAIHNLIRHGVISIESRGSYQFTGTHSLNY